MRRIVEQMETPELIREILGLLPNVPPERRPGVERMFKLSYYFGGFAILSRETPAGLEILASGPVEEVIPVLRSVPEEEQEQWILSYPDPFEDLTIALPPRRAATLAG